LGVEAADVVEQLDRPVVADLLTRCRRGDSGKEPIHVRSVDFLGDPASGERSEVFTNSTASRRNSGGYFDGRPIQGSFLWPHATIRCPPKGVKVIPEPVPELKHTNRSQHDHYQPGQHTGSRMATGLPSPHRLEEKRHLPGLFQQPQRDSNPCRHLERVPTWRTKPHLFTGVYSQCTTLSDDGQRRYFVAASKELGDHHGEVTDDPPEGGNRVDVAAVYARDGRR